MTWILTLALLFSHEGDPRRVEFVPCGFVYPSSEAVPIHGYHTQPAPNLDKIYVIADAVVAVMRVRVIEGPQCTMIYYGSKNQMVIGDYNSVIKKLVGSN